MESISTILKDVVSALPQTVFLRLTDLDANMALDDIDMKNVTVIIYRNLPTITNTIQQGGLVTEDWPTEILVLQLAEIDDNTGDSDTIRHRCKDIADRLMDQLKTRQDSTEPIEAYDIVFTGIEKIHDKIVTGLMLTFDWKIDRTNYNC